MKINSALAVILASLVSLAIASPSEDMVKIGEGKLRYMFWEIYIAELFAASKNFSYEAPYTLSITYLRDISKDDLIESTQKEMQRQAYQNTDNILAWIEGLREIWVDVEKGDELAMRVDNAKVARFYLNREVLGEITDDEFAKAFANIWLSEKTRKPNLRKKLLNL